MNNIRSLQEVRNKSIIRGILLDLNLFRTGEQAEQAEQEVDWGSPQKAVRSKRTLLARNLTVRA